MTGIKQICSECGTRRVWRKDPDMYRWYCPKCKSEWNDYDAFYAIKLDCGCIIETRLDDHEIRHKEMKCPHHTWTGAKFEILDFDWDVKALEERMAKHYAMR